MYYIVVFLLGFISGLFVMEKTRRPTINQNHIEKLKGNASAALSLDHGLEYPETEQPKPRKRFLGIFKRKEKNGLHN